VSWLRPSRTVVDPRGTTWEIYVTRTRIGQWNGISPDVPTGFPSPQRTELLSFLLVPVMMVLELIVGILRLIALVPLSLASVATRRPLRIEAITEYPMRQTYAWNVVPPMLDRVLDEISAALERGSIAHPSDAHFLGEIE
jgi:hypothetical protein